MLSVCYDYQIMLAQKFGGISRYIYEISTRLPEFGVDVSLRCLHNHNYYFAERLGLNDTSKLPKILRLAELGTFHYLNKLMRFADLHLKNYDIFHPTYYYASKPPKGKFIVTVHDMTHELYDGIYPVNKRVIEAKKKIIPQADRIIAVSENTKRDILRYFPEINSDKISVIYHGASMPVTESKGSPFGYDYVLFVGNRQMYKNFSRFTEAMKMLMSERKDVHVFCAGGGNFTDDEVREFGEFSGRFHQEGLSDERLTEAYGGALCFVFPSEYEGFGIPILEAFACNCPVVCADSSSLPEVAGESAVYFDALNAADMAEKIRSVIESEELRRKLKESGRERLKLFDWDRAASETLECYRLAVKGELDGK